MGTEKCRGVEREAGLTAALTWRQMLKMRNTKMTDVKMMDNSI